MSDAEAMTGVAVSRDPCFDVARPVEVAVSTDPGFDIAGPLDAPAIVFLHGTRLTRSAWAGQMADLSDAFRVIAPDLPGHGALAEVPFTLGGAADAMAAVIDQAAGGRAIVVGLSLGGYVAMDLAARWPDRVLGIVASGATAEPDGVRVGGYLSLAWAMERFDGPRLDALNRWYFRRRFPAAIAEPIVAGRFWSKGGASALRSLVGERFVPRLAAYAGPVLLLNGEFDLFFRPGAKRFAQAAPNARRARILRATHLTNLERPGAFNAAVRRFALGLDVAPGGRA